MYCRIIGVRRAIAITGNTSPGPDGVPFEAWRLFGDFAVNLLFEAANDLIADGASEVLDALGGARRRAAAVALELG